MRNKVYILLLLLLLPAFGRLRAASLPDTAYPQWLDDAVFYHIYPSSFMDSDADGYGDLEGIRSKLDYIRYVGFNTIWLSPVFCSAFQDGGYDITDYYNIDPRFGTNADMVRLIEEAHSKGIRVCLDLVAGHTSDRHPWFRESAGGKADSPYARYYIWTDGKGVRPPSPDRDGRAGWVDNDYPRNGYYLKNYYDCQPALNYGYLHPDPDAPWEDGYDSPGPRAVRQELKNIMDFWLSKGVDGFRCDLAWSLVKGDDEQFSGVRRLWEEIFRWQNEHYPQAVFLSEWSSPVEAISCGFDIDIIRHNGCGYTMYRDLVYNTRRTPDPATGKYIPYDCWFDKAGKGRFDTFAVPFEKMYRVTRGHGFPSMPTSSHDTWRLNRNSRNTPRELKTAMMFFLTMPWVPVVYYGEEIGMRSMDGVPDVEGSRDRSAQRTPMQWGPGPTAGFSAADASRIYLPVDRSEHRPEVESQMGDPASVLSWTRDLLAFRASHPALGNTGDWCMLSDPEKPYPVVYRRTDGKESFVVVINPRSADAEAFIGLDGPLTPVWGNVNSVRIRKAEGGTVIGIGGVSSVILRAGGPVEENGYTVLCQEDGPVLSYSGVPLLRQDGKTFKDHNRNGRLDPYEDWRLTPAERAADLAAGLPPEYLSGLMTNGHTVNVPGISSMSVSGITYGGKPYRESGAEPSDICDRLRDALVSFDTRQVLLAHSDGPQTIARWNNNVQALCEGLPFGIPCCNSTDPRNEIKATDEYNAGSGGVCSQWPTPLGLAATFDTTVVAAFASAVKREYLALGFHTALSPQADLATDPRWRRVPGTFGENPELVKAMASAYVHAMQPEVNCIIKHWPGGGTGEGGRDAHLSIGKYGVFPGGRLETHMDAFCLDAAGVMPYYTVSYGQDPSGENVGNSYSSYITDTLLRRQYGYKGIVCTDWGIVPDYNGNPLTTGGKCYGVEDLTIGERILKALEAGVDEFGGSVKASEIMQAWPLWCEKYGEASARGRWELSARRILESFFRTGLFENPYRDPSEAEKVLSDPGTFAAGEDAQRRSVVMLKNHGPVLPLRPGAKVYIPERRIPGVYSMTGRLKKAPYNGYSVDTAEVAKHYTIVSTPQEADFALVAITEPEGGIGYKDGKYMPISLQYSPYRARNARAVSIAGGDPAEKSRNRSYRGRSTMVENSADLDLVRKTKAAMGKKPVVVLLQATRPVVMEFEPWADAILVAFGVRSKAFMEIVSGAFEPTGRLPMQFPASMAEVESQLEDVPQDMEPWKDGDGNIYDFGFGLDRNGKI